MAFLPLVVHRAATAPCRHDNDTRDSDPRPTPIAGNCPGPRNAHARQVCRDDPDRQPQHPQLPVRAPARRPPRAEPDRDYDSTLLFLACVLHDIGLTEQGNRDQRFEVDGADRAAEFLAAQGVASSDIDTVWEAIALHTSGGIAERRGPVCELTRSGIGMDLGRGADIVSQAQADAIHRAYPRLSVTRSLVDAIVDQAQARPQKAPRYTLPGELVRERSGPPQLTALEQGAAAGRWGD